MAEATLVQTLSGESNLMEPEQEQRIYGCVYKTGSGSLLCKKLEIMIYVGEDAESLFSPEGSIMLQSDTPGWAPQNNGKAWEALDGIHKYVLAYEDPTGSVMDTPVNFYINGTVNKTAGSSMVRLENYSRQEELGAWEKHSNTFCFMKAAGQPFIRNFIASVSGETTPCLLFSRGDSIDFSWESYGGYYELFAGDSAEPFYAGTACVCGCGNLTRNQVFILKGTFQGNALRQKPVTGMDSKVIYQVLNIRVKDGDIDGSFISGQEMKIESNARIGQLDVRRSADMRQGDVSAMTVSWKFINRIPSGCVRYRFFQTVFYSDI